MTERPWQLIATAPKNSNDPILCYGNFEQYPQIAERAICHRSDKPEGGWVDVWGELFLPVVWQHLPEEPSVVGCTICGKSFIATHGRQIICSAECRARASARSVTRSRAKRKRNRL